MTITAARPVRATRCLPLDAGSEDSELLGRVVDFYHRKLYDNQAALDYLAGRGIGSQEGIDTFRIGWADRDLGRALPSKEVKAGREIRSRLTQLGIYRQSGHAHFNGCVVFPVVDERNQVREIYGRKIGHNLRKGTEYHLYLPESCRPLGEHRGVWNVAAFEASDEIILCMSIIGALSFWCAGYRNVSAVYGHDGPNVDLMEALQRHRIKRLLIAYDRGEHPDQQALQHAEQFLDMGIECYRVLFPAGMDANEYALHQKPAERSLGEVLRGASWMGNGKPTPHVRVVDADGTTRKPCEAPPPPAASPMPTKNTAPSIDAEVKEQEIQFSFGDRSYRIRGLERNHSYDRLKVNVLVRHMETFHVDTFDLYQSRPRASFVKRASSELCLEESVIKQDLGQVLLKLEQLQDEQIRQALAPKEEEKVEVSAEDRQAALELLLDPDLLSRVLADFEYCGLVGEETNKLVAYLAAISRKLDEPLAVLIKSGSAAGKTTLMDAVLAFVPPEDKVKYSAMTGQSLFYMGDMNLKHKVLAISEEEGVRQAAYALKVLQCERRLKIASTGKDPNTGEMVTQEYCVEGPVMLFLTTTSDEVDKELENRCLTFSVNENRSQTEAIHQQQRRGQTRTGLAARRQREAVIELHQNVQRLLRPLEVVNDYAERLTFRTDQTRARRDHAKYLSLIRAITLLHQYQRPVQQDTVDGERVEYLETTMDDIRMANRLAEQVLGRMFHELPEKTGALLKVIVVMVHTACIEAHILRKDYRFTRKDIRRTLTVNEDQDFSLGHTQLKYHLRRLEDYEYLIVHTGGGRGRLKVYELNYDTDADEPVDLATAGLLDVALLERASTTSTLAQMGREVGANGQEVGY